MIIQVDFGAAQSSIGYRFYDNAGAFVGARVTSGINAGPQAGVYLASATIPSGAVGVYWDCADANFTASEDLTPARTLVAGRPIDVDAAGEVAIQSALGGSGAYPVTVTVTDGTDPLENARVRLTQGINNFVATTDADGVATFALDAATYAIGITKDGYQFTPGAIGITGAGNFDKAMTQIVVSSAGADQATGTLTTFDGQGAIAAGVTIAFQLTSGPGANSFKTQPFYTKSDEDGLLQVALRQGAAYQARRANGDWVAFAVPNSSGAFALPEVLGEA
jgi:hypothetical protein